MYTIGWVKNNYTGYFDLSTTIRLFTMQLILAAMTIKRRLHSTGCSKKTDPLVYFDDNFGKYGLILTIFSLL